MVKCKKLVKISFLLLAILTLTACTTNYDLIINSDQSITEKIYGKVTLKELDNENMQGVNSYLYAIEIATPLINEGDEFNKTIIDKRKYKDFIFTYDYNGNYSKSNALNTCFENIDYEETEDEYKFNISGKFYCMLSKKVTINLISSFGVLENNANKVKGNKYTWIIKDSDNVNISATISKKIPYNGGKKNIFSIIEIVGASIFALLCLVTYFLYKKKNSNNL